MSRINEEVEKFIRRYYDLEIVIAPEARAIIMQDKRSFADCLQNSVIDYMFSENKSEEEKNKKIEVVFAFMTKAYSYGVISPGQDLLGKLDESRKKNADLLNDLATCMANYSNLQIEHERLVRMLDQNQNANQNPDEKPSENDE